jgi:ligand-binding sensor domain-containing protein
VNLALVVLVPESVEALDPSTPPGELGQRRWTVSDGLPGNSVRSIDPTADGSLWLGTDNGLGRLVDGRLQRLGLAPQGEFSRRGITGVRAGSDGTVWFITEAGEIGRRTNDGVSRWLPAASLADASVTSILEDSQGRVWVATAGNGLFLSDGTGSRWLTEADGWTQPVVSSLAEDHRGHVWVGTRGRGVCRFSGLGPVKCADFAGPNVNSVEVNGRGVLLVLTDDWLARVPPNRRIEKWPVRSEGSGQITTAIEDRHGCRWEAVGDTLRRTCGGRTDEFPLTDDSGNGATILSLAEDDQDRLWIGTDGAGLIQLSSEADSCVSREGGADR